MQVCAHNIHVFAVCTSLRVIYRYLQCTRVCALYTVYCVHVFKRHIQVVAVCSLCASYHDEWLEEAEEWGVDSSCICSKNIQAYKTVCVCVCAQRPVYFHSGNSSKLSRDLFSLYFWPLNTRLFHLITAWETYLSTHDCVPSNNCLGNLSLNTRLCSF